MQNSKNKKDERKICRVCGLYSDDFYPWGEDGNTASFEICFCCGTQFGYEDNNINATRANREKWIKNGAKWFNPKYKPENWSLEDQLKNIPEEYR
jgi:hypothetical protein